MRNWLKSRLFAATLALLAAIGPTFAQTGPKPVRNQVQTFNSYTQINRLTDITANTVSQDQAFAASDSPLVVVYNTGSVYGYVALTNASSSTTPQLGIPVPPGSCAALNAVGMTHIQAVTGSGSTVLQISQGWGVPGACGGAGSGGGGGGGGTSSNFGAAFPSLGTAVGMSVAGNMVALTGTGSNLNVQCANCSGSGASATDATTFAPGSSVFAPGGGFYQTTATNNPLTNLQQGVWQLTANRAGFVNLRNSSGTEIGTSSTPVQVTGANGTFPVSGTVTANLGTIGGAATQTTLASILTALGSPFQAGGSIGNTSFGATQSGTWTVQPGNTSNTSPWLMTINQGGNSATVTGANALKVDGSAVTQPVSASSLPLPTGAATSALQPTNAAAASTTSGQTGNLAMGAVTTAAPTYTTATTNNLSLTTAGALRVDASATTQPVSGTVTANQGGTWNITNISGTVSLPTGAATSANQTSVIGSQSGGTAAASSLLAGGIFNSTPITVTNTQQASLQIDANGFLKVNVAAGGASGGTSSTFGAAFPSTGTAAGMSQGGNMVALTGTSGNLNVQCANCSGSGASGTDEGTFTAGTSVFAPGGGFFQTTATNNALTTGQWGAWQMTANRAGFVNLRNASGTEIGTASTPIQVSLANTGSNATAVSVSAAQSGTWNITNISGTVSLPTGAATSANQATAAAQGSTTSGQTGSLSMGAVTTAAPTYTTAQTSPLSLTTAGALRVDASSTTQPVSGTVTANQGGAPWSFNQTQINGVALGSPSNYGTSPGAVSVQGVNAFVTNSVTVAQATAASLNATVVGTGTFAVQAAQSGTWNITNVSGTVSLPTGAATSANQPTNAAIASTTSGQTGGLSMGATTTAAPTYTTAQTNPLSLTTAGALRVDGSGVTQPVSIAASVTVAQATAANLNATVVGTGTFAVQLTGATNNINNISGTVSLPTGAATSANQPTNAGQASTTSGQTGMLLMGAVTTSAPSYTTAQTDPLSLDTSGNLRVNCVTGCGGSGGTSSTFGSAFPTTGTAIGLTNGTNMIAWSATSNYGTAPSAIAVPAVNAAVTNTVTISGSLTNISGTISLPTGASTSANQPTNATQGSTTSGQTGNIVMGAVTTTAPAYTTAQTSPLSLTTSGALRTDVSTVNGTTASAGAGVVGTGSQRIAVGQDTTTIAGSAPGTAGTASTNVLTVQGIASMTPVQVSQATASNLNATVVGTGTFAVQATLQASATTAIGKVDPNTIGSWGLQVSTQNSATPTNGNLMLGQFNTAPTTITSGNVSPVQMDSAGNTLVNLKTALPAGTNLIGKTGVDQTTPGTTNLVNAKVCDTTTSTQCTSVKAASTAAAATDLAEVVSLSPNSPVVSFGAYSTASITRSANTTTYTANTGWNNGTPTFFSFTSACRVNGGQVLIPRIDIWSSANPTLKLTGVLYLFSGVPGTNVSDDATFTIASADFANLTGNFGGFPFSLGNNQASGASNSSASLVGVTYQMQCASGTTTITGMVEVTNAYVPASAEVLHIGLATNGIN